MTSSKRRVEYSAVTAFAPVLALFPVWLGAVALLWIPFNLLFDIPFTHFAVGEFLFGIVLFSRPVQRVLFVRLLGARKPSDIERAHLEPAWKVVEQQVGIRPGRFVLSVADVDTSMHSHVVDTCWWCQRFQLNTSPKTSSLAC